MEFLPMRERMKIERTDRQRTPVEPRIRSNSPTVVEFTLEEAQLEASRCLLCKNPGCTKGCPFSNDIPGFLTAVVEGDLDKASEVLRRTSAMASVCSRVCPHDEVCEGSCILKKTSRPLNIGAVESFITEYEQQKALLSSTTAPNNNKRIAIVGAGPAGMCAASRLLKLGYNVNLIDRHEKLGGLLEYGLPPFRLPRHAVNHEVARLESFDRFEFQGNTTLGVDVQLDNLANSYDGVLIATGTSLPLSSRAKGEELSGVLSAIDHLEKYNTFTSFDDLIASPFAEQFKGKDTAVIGAGDTAMDTSRSLIRLGAKSVSIYYRRTLDEAPASEAEIASIKEEGITFRELVNPVEFLGNDGVLQSVKLEIMELGEEDDSGRRSPVGTGRYIQENIDYVITSLGFKVDPEYITQINLAPGKYGELQTDDNYRTSMNNVFGAGDIAYHGALVSKAGAAGTRAAISMDEYLSS